MPRSLRFGAKTTIIFRDSVPSGIRVLIYNSNKIYTTKNAKDTKAGFRHLSRRSPPRGRILRSGSESAESEFVDKPLNEV